MSGLKLPLPPPAASSSMAGPSITATAIDQISPTMTAAMDAFFAISEAR